MDLIVVEPFEGHERGERISGARTVKAILAGENAHHVRQVEPLPEEPIEAEASTAETPALPAPAASLTEEAR